MQVRKILVLIFCLLTILVGNSFGQSVRNYNINDKIPQEKLQQDLIFLKKALDEAHPTLHWYTSKEDFDHAFALTLEKANRDMTEREFLKILTPLIEYIKCGHTNLNVSKGYLRYLSKEARYFPLAVWISEQEQKVLVRNNNSTDTTILAGMEIFSINKVPAHDIAKKFVNFTPTDGYNITGKYRYAEKKFSSYINYYIGEPDTFHVEIINQNKDTISYALASVTRQEAILINKDKAERRRRQAKEAEKEEQKEAPQKKPRIITYRDNDFQIIQTDSMKVGFMRIRDFEGLFLGSFFRPSFRALKKNNAEHLIIDLRQNPGGFSANAVKLMRFLSDEKFPYYESITLKDNAISFRKQLDQNLLIFLYTTFLTSRVNEDGRHDVYFIRGKNKNNYKKRLNYTKNVYILTTGLTSSAASLFTANMQYQGKAVVIGEETGGGFEGCAGGVIPMLTLPNSKVRLRFPLMQFVNAVSGHPKGHGAIPDHQVDIDFDKFSKGKDNQLQYTFKLISSQKK
jgi:hypothetical protein